MANSHLSEGRPRWKHWLPTGLLLTLILLGASLYRGYGVSWDEPSNHYNGAVNISFLIDFLLPTAWQQRFTPADPLLHPTAPWPGFDHGVAFELPAAALGRLLYPNNPQGYYILRHFLVFLTFCGGVVVVYQLAQIRYPAAQWRPLVGAGALVLSPRFFAEAFYNGKDISFMVAFTLAMLTLVKLVQRPTWGQAAKHAFATALAADVRLTGLVLLPAYTAIGLLLQGWAPPEPSVPNHHLPVAAGKRMTLFVFYCGLAGVLTVMGWPYLWAAPGPRLIEVLGRTIHFPWTGLVLYMGNLESATDLPWHYLPVWIGITTPLPYLVLWLLGAASGLRTLVKRSVFSLRRTGGWLDVLFLAWLSGPIILVILNKSVIYDGWRHLYFVYPALLLIALRGVRELNQLWLTSTSWAIWWLTRATIALLFIGVSHTIWFIAQAYPNQQIYFSCLPTAVAERLFERDYWGLSYRHGLEWLLRHDPAAEITVTGPQANIIYINWLVLSKVEQRRIHIIFDGLAARYYLTTYRWHPQRYADSLGPEVLAYRPGGGVRALSIFRRDSIRRPLPRPPIGSTSLPRAPQLP